MLFAPTFVKNQTTDTKKPFQIYGGPVMKNNFSGGEKIYIFVSVVNLF